MKSMIRIFAVCGLVVWHIGASGAETVRIQLKWYHQAQFAGCYVAQEKGFYRDQGLEVELVEGGPGLNQTQALVTGKAQFAISSPEDLLMHRSQGDKVAAVAAVYRKSAVVFLSRLDDGILRPGDFRNKTIAVQSSGGISDFKIQFDALMRNMGVDLSGVRLVPYDPEYKGFREGKVDITPAYFTGGLIKLRSWNIKVNVIYPGDYRVRFYSDILMTTDRLIRDNPDLVSGVVKATLKGWQFAIENPEESVSMVMAHARIQDPVLQRQMLEAAIPLIHTGDNPIGWMTRDEWVHMHRILLEQQIIPAPVTPLESIFNNGFVEQLYREAGP